jgi:hypothetical protein
MVEKLSTSTALDSAIPLQMVNEWSDIIARMRNTEDTTKDIEALNLKIRAVLEPVFDAASIPFPEKLFCG